MASYKGGYRVFCINCIFYALRRIYLCILCLPSLSSTTIAYVKPNEIRYFPRASLRGGIVSRDTKVELHGSKVREHPVRSDRK